MTMGQITQATIDMIDAAVASGEYPPLTLWEIKQLAQAWKTLHANQLSAQSVSAVQPVAKVISGEISPGFCMVEILSYEMLPLKTKLYTHPADVDAGDCRNKTIIAMEKIAIAAIAAGKHKGE
jgi:hypothetical protein